jgi:predicted alpha/beta superfamily hydrolase
MAWTSTDFVLTCDTSGIEHAVSVTTPFRYESMDVAPLILCLDGAWTAGTVRDATRIMSMSGESPEAIVAALSFTDDSMSDYLRSRARWFCPTEWVPPEETGVKDIQAEDTGQALTYLAFIRDQVLPRLSDEWRVSETWLVGHSFSGLFGLRVLFSEPELFDKYLLASPSIWWDDRTMLDIEADFAAAHHDLAARVFLTAGQDENMLEGFNMCGNMIDMATRLENRSYPNLDIGHTILPSESHSSTIGAAISRGLRHLH